MSSICRKILFFAVENRDNIRYMKKGAVTFEEIEKAREEKKKVSHSEILEMIQ